MPRQASIEPSGSSTLATSILLSGLSIASPLPRGAPEPARAAGPLPVRDARLLRHRRLVASRPVRRRQERRPGGSHTIRKPKAYVIVSGSGTLVTGGHIVNGSRSGPDSAVTRELNGPSCSGLIAGSDIVKRAVKTGDIIIIPAGVPHGWTDITDHVDYLSLRPSGQVLEAGYVHPAIRK